MSNPEMGNENSMETYEQLVKKRNYKPTNELQEQFKTSDSLNNINNVHRQGTPIQELINDNSDKIKEDDNGTSIHDLLSAQQEERSVFDKLPNPNQETINVLDEHLQNIQSINASIRENIKPPETNFNIHNNFKKKDEEIKKQYEEMTKSREQLDGSFPLIKQPTSDYKIIRHFVSIDSIDRDLELYPNPTDFRVQFNAESDSIKYKKKYYTNPSTNKETLLYTAAIKNVGIRAAPIQETIKNIKSIKLKSVVMPNSQNGIFTMNQSPFLLLNIPELENKYLGTNIATNNASMKIINRDDNSINGSRNYVFMEPINCNGFEYNPAPLANLNSLTLQIMNNRNINFSIGNDKLDIISINDTTTTSKNEVDTKCYSKDTKLLDIQVYMKFNQGITEDEIKEELIKEGEIIYIYNTNTCYDNEFFNLEIDSNFEIILSPSSGPSEYKLELTYNGENAIHILNSLNNSQYIKLITTSGDKQIYQMISKNSDHLLLRHISGGTSIININNISVSYIYKKGIQSNDCCCLNYVNGVRVINNNNYDSSKLSESDECEIHYCHTFQIRKPENFNGLYTNPGT